MNHFESTDAVPRMLVADDDPAILRVLVDRCGRMGFSIETATNGSQVLLAAARFKPDVLLIDVHLPEIDGLSVCARLLEPDGAPPRIVMVTGSRDPDTVKKCENSGARYVYKGSHFWADLETTLAEIYPERASRIVQSGLRAVGITAKRQPRVLLVDDDVSVREFLAARLRKCGVDVLHASDVVEAYRISYRDEPTAIVTDYFMPNGDGQSLLGRLRGTPATRNIPVLVLSGRDLSDFVKQGLRKEISGCAGAAQILRKSMDTSELFGALQKFCGFAPAPAPSTIGSLA